MERSPLPSSQVIIRPRLLDGVYVRGQRQRPPVVTLDEYPAGMIAGAGSTVLLWVVGSVRGS